MRQPGILQRRGRARFGLAVWSSLGGSSAIQAAVVLWLCCWMPRLPAAPALVEDVERQPLAAATVRLVTALASLGAPLPPSDLAALDAAAGNADPRASVVAIQQILDRHCLAVVTINPESRVSVTEGPAPRELVEQGWRTFLVKVVNEARINPELKVSSPQAAPMFMQGGGERQRPQADGSLVTAIEAQSRFLDLEMPTRQPLVPRLSGLPVEYRILQLFCRDAGDRDVELAFSVGQGTQDIGFRNTVPLLFKSLPSIPVRLSVADEDGRPTTASFVFRDEQGRIYPNPTRRLAPDFFFHEQVYRADGESVSLPPGRYLVEVRRGPEYLPLRRNVEVPTAADSHHESFQLARWIHAAVRHWYSGDHHVHAAGCAHYDSPTEGVGPDAMMRHIVGEDLNVGCVLSWGPCWYAQKQFFDGRVSPLSVDRHLMRYDIEVSGFPSSPAGHLCLLRLTEDDYPGTTLIEEWPSWTLPVLAWGRRQGAVVGYSHSGWGLALPDRMPDGTRQFPPGGQAAPGWQGRAADALPDQAMPPFDGIGANEFIVAAAHDICDFISTVDTPAIWELNIWYHVLNCGLRTRISGETDFPCIYGDRVGLGRVYVKLDPAETLSYDAWVEGLRRGRSYCGDGLSHVFDFTVGGQGPGEAGPDGFSELRLKHPGPVTVAFDVAARLEEHPTEATEAIRRRRLDEKPYWHVERSRVGTSRRVPVEVIVNGRVAASQEIEADGRIVHCEHEIDLPHSAWVAIRILPSVHTNPVFVEVAGRPIRASRSSAEWCRRAVDICWQSKQAGIRPRERAEAAAAYDLARKVYDQAILESVAD
jgi:hypothetical protein